MPLRLGVILLAAIAAPPGRAELQAHETAAERSLGLDGEAVLGPVNHNVLTPFFLPMDNAELLVGAFGDVCGEAFSSPPSAEGYRRCDEAPLVQWDVFTLFRFHCCLILGLAGGERQRLPSVQLSHSVEGWERGTVTAMIPRVPQAYCVAAASARLLEFFGDFDRCASASSEPLACLRSTALRHEELDRSSDLITPAGCLGSLSGFEGGWRDTWSAFEMMAQQPVAAEHLKGRVRAALEAVNSYIWQLAHLRLDVRTNPESVSSFKRIKHARFRLAHGGILGSPLPVQGHLNATKAIHRGDVLLRLLLGLDASRRAAASPASHGLVLVELGTGEGDLAQWLALRTRGLVATLHIVDTFVHAEENGRFDQDRLEAVLNGLQRIGLVPSSDKGAATVAAVLMWPRGGGGAQDFRLYVHSGESAAAAAAVEAADLVFVDAAHSYAHVKNDIEAWWPKIPAGGCMAGHDFRHLERAFWEVGGVREAVAESFTRDIFLDADTVWWHLK